MENKKVLYPNLRALMAKNGHTVNTLGNILLLSPTSAGRRLRGETDFTLDDIKKVCKFYGKTFEEIFG